MSTAFTGDDVCLFYFSLVNLFSKVMRDGAHSPRIRLASLFFFTECKPPIPQTVHSKPRHMQVTFRGNSRGVNGMKDRSSLWDVTVKVRGKKSKKTVFALPLDFVSFLDRRGVRLCLYLGRGG